MGRVKMNEGGKTKGMVLGVFLLLIVGVCGCLESTEERESQAITANFTYSPSNPTTNDIIQFTDKSTSTEGSITSWYWEFDATKQYTDSTSALQNPTYRYQFGYGRTFSVKLTVTDNKGNSNSITKNIAIAHQSHIPQGNDITLEVLSHERKNYDLDGSSSPLEGWTYVWLTVKLTNNWNSEIIPRWDMHDEPYWGDHFYIYTNYDPNDWWGYRSISPNDAPEKLAPGESFTWTITFLMEEYNSWLGQYNNEYKVEFAYYYDVDLGGKYKEVTFSTFL